MKKENRNWLARLLAPSLFCAMAVTALAEPTLTIDAGSSTGTVSPTLYGLMTEEINHSYDGGLYAELICNRTFMDNADTPVNWSTVADRASEAAIILDTNQMTNGKLTLRLDISKASEQHPAGLANTGYWGIPVLPSTKYQVRFSAKASSDFFWPGDRQHREQ